MEYLYAPWREQYLKSKEKLCVFCECAKNKEKDAEYGVIFRAKYCYGVMNRFPYTPGHFMIIPYLHEENLEKLDEKIWQEMSYYVQKSVLILKNELKAGGVNIGMNLSKDAGAGIAQHCHYHLVPRWAGDTNFMTSIAQTRVCGNDLLQIYKKLKKAFKELT